MRLKPDKSGVVRNRLFLVLGILLVSGVSIFCAHSPVSAWDPHASSGSHPIKLDPPFGKAFVKPGPEHVVHWNKPFRFSLEYFTGPEGVPPGGYLELIPFPHMNYTLPKVSVWTNDKTKRFRIVVDHFYNSLRLSEPGAPARFLVVFDDGLEEGEAVQLTYEIPKKELIPFCYGIDGGCEATFHLKLKTADDKVLTSFTAPDWKTAVAPPSELRVHVPSQAETGEEVEALVVFGGLFGRPVDGVESEVQLTVPQSASAPATLIRFTPRDRGAKRVPVTFGMPGVFRLSAKSDKGFVAVSNPIRIGDADRPGIYWGDLHNHTVYSWDSRNLAIICVTPLEMARIGRDRMLLDYIAITDHGQHMWMTDYVQNWRTPVVDMPEDEWNRYERDVLSVDHPGIITFLGYEHRDLRGDTCIIFRDHGSYFIEDGQRLFVKDMWERHKPGEILTIPHFHPLFGDEEFDKASPHERLAELHSVHGMFEYYKNPHPQIPRRHKPWANHDVRKKGPFYRGLLDKGFRFGVTASSDHGITGQLGLTAVKAEEKTRDAIFDALLARRTYADTGARMLMDFRIAGLDMGEEQTITSDDSAMKRRRIEMEIHAPAPIETVQIIRNGKAFFQRTPLRADWKAAIADEDNLAAVSQTRELTGKKSTYYYLRVKLKNGHVGWTSPIFFLLEDDRNRSAQSRGE